MLMNSHKPKGIFEKQILWYNTYYSHFLTIPGSNLKEVCLGNQSTASFGSNDDHDIVSGSGS